jgi:hypothetical protein
MEHDPLKGLTKEVIEACLGRDRDENMRLLTAGDSYDFRSSDLYRDVEAFNKLITDSDPFAAQIVFTTLALFDNNWLLTPRSLTADRAQNRVTELLETGVLAKQQQAIVIDLVRKFFFIGWYARGAVEEANEIRRIAGNQG